MQNCALGLNRCCSHCGGVRRCPCGLTLYHGDKKLGEGRIKTQPGMFYDYPNGSAHHFTGGTIKRVAVDVSGDPYIDLEREAQAMLARELGPANPCLRWHVPGLLVPASS